VCGSLACSQDLYKTFVELAVVQFEEMIRIRVAASSPAIFVLTPTNAPIGATANASYLLVVAPVAGGSISFAADGTAKGHALIRTALHQNWATTLSFEGVLTRRI
jgi:hypothetical protein